jgi:4-amino-4-deoxy-L-arabinose transferase-like glycosyltransferase
MPHSSRRAVDYALLLAVLALVALPTLGATSLWDRDEGYYCAVAQEMLAAGDWVKPTFNGELFSEKPPLLYWTQMAAFSLLGVNEFAARIPTVFAAAAVLLLVYELARQMFDRTTALGAGLVLATCIEFCLQAHAATPDMLLVAFTVGSLLCFWRGLEGPRPNAWHLAAGVFTGLAILTKGPVGIVLPGLVVALYAVWNREPWLLARASIWRGMAVAIAVSAPWYVAVAWQTDYAFLADFFGTHNVGRFVTPLQNHRGSMFYQLLGVLIFYSPWNLVLLAVVVASVQLAWRKLPLSTVAQADETLDLETSVAGQNAYRFLLAWVVTYLVFFSLAATQLPHYVFPLYPPLAILTARYLDRWRRKLIAPGALLEWTAWGSYVLVGVVAGVGLLIVGGAVRVPLGKVDVIPGLAIWSLAALCLPVAAVIALVARKCEHRGAALGSLGIGALLFAVLLSIGPPQRVERLKAPRDLAKAVHGQSQGQTVRLASLSYFQPSLVYYLGPVVERLPGKSSAREMLDQDAPACLLLPAKQWDALAKGLDARCRVLHREYDLYTREEIVAVCNFPELTDTELASQTTATTSRH